MCWDFDYEKPIDDLNDFQQVSHVQNSVFQIQTEIGFLFFFKTIWPQWFV